MDVVNSLALAGRGAALARVQDDETVPGIPNELNMFIFAAILLHGYWVAAGGGGHSPTRGQQNDSQNPGDAMWAHGNRSRIQLILPFCLPYVTIRLNSNGRRQYMAPYEEKGFTFYVRQ